MSGISTNITSLLAKTLIILLPFHLIHAHLLTPVPRLTFHSLTTDKGVLFPAVQRFIYPCSGFCSFPFPHRAWQSISCFLSPMFHVLLSFWIFPIIKIQIEVLNQSEMEKEVKAKETLIHGVKNRTLVTILMDTQVQLKQ